MLETASPSTLSFHSLPTPLLVPTNLISRISTSAFDVRTSQLGAKLAKTASHIKIYRLPQILFPPSFSYSTLHALFTMSSAGPSRSPQPSSRFHPYTLHPHSHSHPSHHAEDYRTKSRRLDCSPVRNAKGEYPPSPPHSRRDASETPSVSLSMAFGGMGGGKWWDEELVSLIGFLACAALIIG